MKMSFSIFVLIAIFMTATLSYAVTKDEAHSIELPKIAVELRAGDGKETTERFCNICHSLEYITMQPPLSKAQWTATANKMIIPDETSNPSRAQRAHGIIFGLDGDRHSYLRAAYESAEKEASRASASSANRTNG